MIENPSSTAMSALRPSSYVPPSTYPREQVKWLQNQLKHQVSHQHGFLFNGDQSSSSTDNGMEICKNKKLHNNSGDFVVKTVENMSDHHEHSNVVNTSIMGNINPQGPAGSGSICRECGHNLTGKGNSNSSGTDSNKLNQRLKEMFKERITSFREAVYLLTGYKVLLL